MTAPVKMASRGFFLAVALTAAAAALDAGERELMDLAGACYREGEYHCSITEVLRYQCLYPKGSLFSESMLILGKAYYRGENYGAAVSALEDCHRSFPAAPAGEEARYLLAVMRLEEGSPFYAIRSFNQYLAGYAKGRFAEEARLGLCYAAALEYDPGAALDEIRAYRKEFPGGKLGAEAGDLEELAAQELARPKKNPIAAGVGSAVFPGFGFFYTGNYGTGFLSLFSNALCIFLIYQGYASGNMFQTVFFSIVELSFYQYSLFGGIRSAYEYNRRDEFSQQVRLRIGKTLRF